MVSDKLLSNAWATSSTGGMSVVAGLAIEGSLTAEGVAASAASPGTWLVSAIGSASGLCESRFKT